MSDQNRIRVFSVDDHPLLREGIAAIINNQPDMVLIEQAATGRESIEGYRKLRPDVTLMDLRLPDMSGIDVLIAIRNEFPNARVIMLTTFEGDVEIKRAMEAGAWGYVLKNMPPRDLVEVIRQVHSGKKRVLPEVASNRNRDIAELLFISEETVKVHVKHLMDKLGASDRTQAVAIAVRRGIIHL
jgi:DNA-binding NarL/FixJ family response regulator